MAKDSKSRSNEQGGPLKDDPTDTYIVPAPRVPKPSRAASPSPSMMVDDVTGDIPIPPPPPSPSQATAQSSFQQPPAPLAKTFRMPELGLLDPLMKDPNITEIMVNDIRNIVVEKEGKLAFAGFALGTIDELNRLTRNILDITGRILSPDQPYVDVMLPDGSRVNIVGPPLTMAGPCLTIRKFPARTLTVDDLITNQMLTQHAAHFLNACVFARMNILISGGTGSGKTTLLNALAGFIPKNERIVMIEDTPELTLAHANSVRLQTKPQSPGSASIQARELVSNALRMRPDRIIVGECRRSEAFDMLQAMNTGHEGSMTSLHSNSTRDALSRLETLCMMAGLEIPLSAIRRQIQSAIDVIIQVRRFRNGKRLVVAVSEVTGIEGDTITLQEIFAYAPETKQLKAKGMVPTFLDRFKEFGLELPANYFG